MNEDLQLLLAEEEAPKAIDPLETIVSPITRSYGLILATGVIGAVIGVISALFSPNEYMSTGKILIHVGARESATPESTITDSGSTNANNRDAVNNEVHLLHDPAVFRRTAMTVGPAKLLEAFDPAAHDDDQTSPVTHTMHAMQSWWFGAGDSESGHQLDNCDSCIRAATKQLIQGITIQAEPYSSIIGVSYGTHSPALAQEVVEAFIAAADEHHRSTFASDTSLQFLEEQVDSALATAMNADQELTGFRISCNVYDIPEQRDNLITVSHALEQEIATDENRLTELNTLIKFIGEELTTVATTIHMVDSDGLRPGVGGGTSSSQVNPRWTRLNETLDQSKVERSALKSSSTLKHERHNDLKDKLVKLEQCEPQHRLLEIDADRKRARATRFLEAYDRAELLHLLDQVEMSNLRVIQAATFPLGRIGPLRAKRVVIALVLGLALGIGLAFALHIFDRRLRTANQAESILSIPVIAVIPAVRGAAINKGDASTQSRAGGILQFGTRKKTG